MYSFEEITSAEALVNEVFAETKEKVQGKTGSEMFLYKCEFILALKNPTSDKLNLAEAKKAANFFKEVISNRQR